MGVPLTLLDVKRHCPKCGGKAPIWDPVCLDCGHEILPKSWLRISGPILLLLGGGIAVTMGYITYWEANVMLHTNDPGATVRYRGTRLQAVVIFAVMYAVFMFGLTTAAIGAGQILRATRSTWIIRLAIGAYVLAVIAFALMQWGASA